MAQKNVQPKADQPRVTTGDISKDQPNLQYKVQGIKNLDRAQTRPAKRLSRGYYLGDKHVQETRKTQPQDSSVKNPERDMGVASFPLKGRRLRNWR